MAEFLPPPPPRSPGYLNPDIRRVLGDVIATLQGRGPLADPQFRADVSRNAGDVPHGVSRGISADLLGAPVDAVAQVMSIPRMLGMASAPDFRQRPFGGSQQIGELLQRFGLLRAPTGSPAETVGRVVGGAMASPKVVGPVMGTAEDAIRYGALGLSQPSPLTVWHGTPHRFAPEPGKPLGSFRSDKIGTGEGAQAYGHGLYFAESPDVAKSYVPKSGAPSWKGKEVKAYGMDGSIDFADGTRAVLGDNEWSAFRKAMESGPRSGNLYKADLSDAAIPRMLDWDKPLSQQHPDVRAAITPEKLGLEIKKVGDWYGFVNDKGRLVGYANKDPEALRAEWMRGKGDNIYDIFKSAGGTPQSASEALRKAGIPGISYLDGSSRAAGQGTRNFVVFPGNEDLLKILERQ